MTTITFWYAKKWQKIRFHWDFNYIKKILGLSLPYGIALFLGVIFFKIDILLLQILENPSESATNIALYSAPMKLIDVGMMYGTIFLNSLLPILTQSIHENRRADTKNLSAKCLELLVGFGVGISVFLAFFAENILTFIYNPEIVQTASASGFTASDATMIVAWIFLFYFISSLTNYILIAKNEQKKIIYINLFIAIVNIIGNLIFIPHFSFIGAGFVTIASQIILVIISAFFIRRELSLGHSLLKMLYFLVAGFFAIFIALQVKNILPFEQNFYILAICGTIFGIIYLAFWFVLKKFLQKK